MNIRIEPEFENKIPPLTEDEYRQLEENIRADGVIINPIITWNGAIVDGHSRFRIAEANPEIRYTTFEKSFPDAEAAVAWICKHQLGRRNLTPEQRKYLISKQYESEKMSHGGDRRSGKGRASPQNGNLKTCERIARENNVSKVSYRDGVYYVFDGQHTIAARKHLNGDRDLEIKCKVYFGLSAQEEALLFAQQTGYSKALSSGARLRALIAGNDRVALAFKAATEDVGIELDYDQGTGKHRLGCVRTAMIAYIRMGRSSRLLPLRQYHRHHPICGVLPRGV